MTWRFAESLANVSLARPLLTKAGMTYRDLVCVRTYLGHPDYDESVPRRKYLRDHSPAVTVVCSQLVRSGWKIEIDAVAATTT